MTRDFGFTVSRDRSIDYDRNDLRLARAILSHEPSLRACIGCGSCTDTCSTGHLVSFNIRSLHTRAVRGETAMLKEELARCMFCGKCQLVCPRGVNLRNVILALHLATRTLP